MDDHKLKAFCLVVELKSFSKAAEVKFMTQSAMSHLIKSLENTIGMKLLLRKGKSIVPTPAGRILYNHARQILNQYQTMANDIYAAVNVIKGPLFIGTSPLAAKYLLPQVFYDFSKNHHEVQINLSLLPTEKIIDELIYGKIDIGIVAGSIKDTRIVFDKIAEDEIVLIASDQNPLTKKTQITAQDLISQSFIMPEAGSGTREFINDFLSTIKIDMGKITILMTLDDPELLVQMVQSGLGISFVSKWSAFKAIKEGTIKVINIPGKRLSRHFYLIGLDKHPSTMAAKTFSEFVKGYRFFIPF
jgi:LysR family transcriptional regulator, transcriptional activator of the cysJI operon